MEQKIKEALEQIRPILQRDGGDIEFVDLTDDTVHVRLQVTVRDARERE